MVLIYSSICTTFFFLLLITQSLVTTASLIGLNCFKNAKNWQKKSQKSGKSEFAFTRKKGSYSKTNQDREFFTDTFLPNGP